MKQAIAYFKTGNIQLLDIWTVWSFPDEATNLVFF